MPNHSKGRLAWIVSFRAEDFCRKKPLPDSLDPPSNTRTNREIVKEIRIVFGPTL